MSLRFNKRAILRYPDRKRVAISITAPGKGRLSTAQAAQRSAAARYAADDARLVALRVALRFAFPPSACAEELEDFGKGFRVVERKVNIGIFAGFLLTCH